MATTLLFNKPFNVLCQFRDAQARACLGDFIDVGDVYAAGRLDRDSEGLLVLTDDGALNHKITDPANKMSKTYWVQVEGIPSEADLAPLAEGIELKDGLCLPAKFALGEPVWPAGGLWPRVPPIRVRQAQPPSPTESLSTRVRKQGSWPAQVSDSTTCDTNRSIADIQTKRSVNIRPLLHEAACCITSQHPFEQVCR